MFSFRNPKECVEVEEWGSGGRILETHYYPVIVDWWPGLTAQGGTGILITKHTPVLSCPSKANYTHNKASLTALLHWLVLQGIGQLIMIMLF